MIKTMTLVIFILFCLSGQAQYPGYILSGHPEIFRKSFSGRVSCH